MTPQTQKVVANHAVRIHLNGNEFRYAGPQDQNAATIVVRKGDRVTWSCDHGNYSVLFTKESPFADIAIHGRRGGGTLEAVVVGAPGSYKYAVTVSADQGMLVDDPEIIVNDGE